jgi:hypothetical protein
MRHCAIAGAFVLTALAVSSAVADEALKSGPKVGFHCTPFHPLNVNGGAAGKKACQV